jgi:hypothetical protein
MLLKSCRKDGTLQAAEKLDSAVILRSSGDEESRIALNILRARFFAVLRMTANRPSMTAL